MRELDRSRRGFLKASVIAGLTVIVAPLGSRAFAALFEEKLLTPLQWDAASGGAKFRIDGIAKVTGAKVFARDVDLSARRRTFATHAGATRFRRCRATGCGPDELRRCVRRVSWA